MSPPDAEIAEVSGAATPTGVGETNGAAGGAQQDAGTISPTGSGVGGVTCASGVGGSFAVSDSAGPAVRYDFETTADSWVAAAGSSSFEAIAPSTDQRFAGQSALSITVAADGPRWYMLAVDPAMPAIPAGAVVTLFVYVPTGAAIAWVQPFVQETADAWTWTGVFADAACMSFGSWTRLTLAVPTTNTAPVQRLGLQFYVSAAWSGSIYIDSVSW